MSKTTWLFVSFFLISASSDAATFSIAVPNALSIDASSSVNLSVSGGVPPYTYSARYGSVAVSNGVAVYTAPAFSGTDSIQIKDYLLNSISTSVTVYPKLTLGTSSIQLSAGESYLIYASGGKAPYQYAIVSGGGSLSGAAFTAPTVPGATQIKVSDSLGQSLIFSENTIIPAGAGTNSSIAYSGAADIYSDETNMRFRKGLSTFDTAKLTLVPTYESVGIYLPATTTSLQAQPQVSYRVYGTNQWKNGYPLWLDTRNNEFRGSLVSLQAGTNYEVRVAMSATESTSAMVTTWSNTVPVGKTIYLPTGTTNQTLVANESGTPSGYVVYTVVPGTNSQIDMGSVDLHSGADCVDVNASYVVIRGLTLKNCQGNGIRVFEKSHHVVIEGNDISGFGTGPGGAIVGPTSTIIPGREFQAGVFCDNATAAISDRVSQITVQRNRIHDPRYGSIHWGYAHPNSAQAVTFSHCGANNVFRYNEIYSSQGHYFNDGIGGGSNFSFEGFPNADSDIYGNKISETYDDAIESEGGNRNVRIWGNYLHHNFVKIAMATVSVGPIYAFRNISAESGGMGNPNVAPDSEARGEFFKVGSLDPVVRGGRTYIFHNTAIQPQPPAGAGLYTFGDGGGISMAGGPVYNIVSRNNIFSNYITKNSVIRVNATAGPNDVDYDLYIGSFTGVPVEPHGINAAPLFSVDVDPHLIVKNFTDNGSIYKALTSYEGSKDPGAVGIFSLTSSSPGYHQGQVLFNFNDQYSSPDMGAHQSGTSPMQFGVDAYR